MSRWIGIALLVLSALVLFAGWATWSEMGEEGGTLGSMRAVSADEFEDARTGEQVVVEGAVAEPAKELIAPASRREVAWYSVRREHRWEQRRQYCKRLHYCRYVWDKHEDEPTTETSKTLDVRLDHSSTTVTVTVPDDMKALQGIDGKEIRRDLDVAPTKVRRNDHEVMQEYVIEAGETITVAGKVSATGDARTITRVPNTSLVYLAPRSSVVEDLEEYETTGIVMMVVGALIGLGGVALIRRSRAQRTR